MDSCGYVCLRDVVCFLFIMRSHLSDVLVFFLHGSNMYDLIIYISIAS